MPSLLVLLLRVAYEQLVLKNVTILFRNPAPLDSCSQLTQRAVFALQQIYANTSITLFNETAGRIAGNVTIRVDVRNGSTDATRKLPAEHKCASRFNTL
jgi:hypothetical protein